MGEVKLRTALIVIDTDDTEIVVRERRADIKMSSSDWDVRMSPDAARALAKHLNAIARRVENRPDGVP